MDHGFIILIHKMAKKRKRPSNRLKSKQKEQQKDTLIKELTQQVRSSERIKKGLDTKKLPIPCTQRGLEHFMSSFSSAR